MARNDGRIEAGQKLAGAISARAWNRAQDAADRVLGAGTGFSATGQQYGSAPYTVVYAKNISGSTAARWGVFAITGMEIAPTAGSGEKQFEEMPVVKIVATPNQSLFRCVAIEPIADGKIGRVAVEGVVQLRLENLSKATGARVLWKGDEGWALVALNCGFLLCKTTAVWEKNTAATLQIWNDVSQSQLGMDGLIESQSSGETVRGYNKYANIPANRFCSLALHPNGRWYVVAAEC